MLIITLILLLPPAYSLIGYDCGSTYLNVTKISLLRTGDCDLDIQQPNVTNVYVQLLQLSQYKSAEVIQCKVEISRTIYHCDMHSNISEVSNGHAEYLLETDYTVCQRMLNDGVFSLGNGNYIKELKPNQTITRSITLRGTTRNDGSCQGFQYSDPYGTWDSVVVQGVIRITLRTRYAPVHLESNKIILRTGTACTFAAGYCIDSEDGYSYWKPFPASACKFDHYDVLYEGPATRISGKNHRGTLTIFSLTTKNTTFALMKTGEEILCGYRLLQTEHHKLFILETEKGKTFAEKSSIPVDHMDLFSYINFKFVYVERHVRTQMTTLYHDVIRQKCLEKEVLQNTLGFATVQPDEFAYRLMNGPGFMATLAGEFIHVVKCIPVDVIVRKTQQCYNELPVTFLNTSYFLTPKSRILTKFGAERECKSLLLVNYQTEDTWVKFTPKPEEARAPQLLRPMSLTWEYKSPENLATSGIYTAKDLEKLRDRIMFPAENPALERVFNILDRGENGHPVQSNSCCNLHCYALIIFLYYYYIYVLIYTYIF